MNEAIVSEITNCIKAHLERVGDLWEAPALKVAEAYKYKPDHFERFCAAKGLSSRQRLILGAVLISYTYPTFFNSIVVSLPLASAKSLGCYNELNTGISYPTIQTLLFIHCGYFFEGEK